MTLQVYVPADPGSIRILDSIRKRFGLGDITDRDLFRRTYCCYHDRSLADRSALEAADQHHRQFASGAPLPLFVLRYASDDVPMPEKLKG